VCVGVLVSAVAHHQQCLCACASVCVVGHYETAGIITRCGRLLYQNSSNQASVLDRAAHTHTEA